jgi:phosphate transport system substrate-binding protein
MQEKKVGVVPVIRRSLGSICVLAALASLTGCPSDRGPTTTGGPVLESSQTLVIDGSSTVYPVTEAVAEEFWKVQPKIRFKVGSSGTGAGFEKFAAGETDISNASRPIKDSEREACQAKGVEFVEFMVAYDGLSVVVHPQNTWCDCLTVEQLKQLWQPESTVAKWSDLKPGWPEETIELYGPGTDSGTFDYFNEVINGDAKKSRSEFNASENDNVLVTGVAGNRFALGYFGYAYYEENKERLKLLGIDGGDGNCIQPSLETVRGSTYKPLSRPLYIYVSKKAFARPEVQAFVKFYVESAAELVSEVGYMPVPAEVAAENRKRLNDALAEFAAAK